MTDVPPRQPIFNIPRSILALIGGMAAIHAARLLLSDEVDADLLVRLAFVPARLTAGFDPAAVAHRLSALLASDPSPDGPAAVGRFFIGSGSLQPWTVLTYALLHGSWVHFGLNAIWLLAFGAPVARRFGPLRFLIFFAIGAAAGAFTHYAVDPLSMQPLVGASAAVSACMGAALRFMFRRPEAGALTPAHAGPRWPLRTVLSDRRTLGFAAVWLLTNLVTGIGAVPLGFSEMPIAWQAHMGGFAIGLLAFPLFDPIPHPVSDLGPDEVAPEVD